MVDLYDRRRGVYERVIQYLHLTQRRAEQKKAYTYPKHIYVRIRMMII